MEEFPGRCFDQPVSVCRNNSSSLNAPIATKVVCFSRLLKCLRSLYSKQRGPRTDCSCIGAVCSGSTLFASLLNFFSSVRQLFAADNFSRRHFQMHFFLVALRVTSYFLQVTADGIFRAQLKETLGA